MLWKTEDTFFADKPVAEETMASLLKRLLPVDLERISQTDKQTGEMKRFI